MGGRRGDRLALGLPGAVAVLVGVGLCGGAGLGVVAVGAGGVGLAILVVFGVVAAGDVGLVRPSSLRRLSSDDDDEPADFRSMRFQRSLMAILVGVDVCFVVEVGVSVFSCAFFQRPSMVCLCQQVGLVFVRWSSFVSVSLFLGLQDGVVCASLEANADLITGY